MKVIKIIDTGYFETLKINPIVYHCNGKFYNENLYEIKPTDEMMSLVSRTDDDDDKNDPYYVTRDELTDEITDFSDEEIQFEIDDVFGNFGFKDRNGNVIIEPQFASAGMFSHGLCNVCLKRTWYTTHDGKHYYETHWGYIDALGKTIIPFRFREAKFFNQYGLAVVSDEYTTGGYLIDTTGKPIENTIGLNLSLLYDCTDRYIDFSPIREDESDDANDTGLYDTKECRVVFPAEADMFIDWNDDLIEVYFHKQGCERVRFINSKGEYIHEWLNEYENPEVWEITTPDVAIVAEERIGYKNPREKLIYGLAHKDRGLVIPYKYDKIQDLGNGIFVCTEGNIATIIDIKD
ncbi:MAG: WG repeat-containing protein [Eubacteriales bacterium]|nr:WG repeat-containing protein [Eubacteriales bacterium]